MRYVMKIKSFTESKTEFEDIDNLMNAIRHENIKLVILLIENGCDINKKDFAGNTALMTSLYIINLKISELLIKNGANVNIKDKYGNTPLLYCAQRAYNYDVVDDIYVPIIKTLIEFGADWNIKDKNNHDFLYYLDDQFEGHGFIVRGNRDREEIINLYPEQYKEYLMKKNAEKYNL